MPLHLQTAEERGKAIGGTLSLSDMSDQERIAAALTDRYLLERELGSGGMAVVYLAEDVKHHRKVAVKVLRSDLAAILGAERFLQEIEVTANLQHPRILQLYDSGHVDSVAYYVMPYVEGESLRQKLDREKQLSIKEAIKITEGVAAALDYAHRHGVVHRDIKPENILIHDDEPLVADFGISRAMNQAAESRLTETGMSLGTPTYMSPEQATGERELDGRSDVYGLGCVLYEMLAGRPPFDGATVESVVHQHLSATAPPVATIRPSVPPSVDHALRFALEKNPADRPKTASEFADLLVSSAAGAAETGQRSLIGAVSRYLVGFAAILAATVALVILLGLPDWVTTGMAVLVALGVPIALTVEWFERHGQPERGWFARLFTRRRAVTLGLVLLVGWGFMAAGYMATRNLGIGPAGSLIATGAFAERDAVVVPDFEGTGVDSLLTRALTDAFKIDLSQSRVVRVRDAESLSDELQRMGREPGLTFNLDDAMEVAIREGLKVVLAGQIDRVGSDLVISARLIAPDTRETIVGFRETARDTTDLSDALGRLSDDVRARIGESLRSIRRSPPLEEVTTPSLDALRRYSNGYRLFLRRGPTAGEPLIREAIALDSNFAMAWRALGAVAGSRAEESHAQTRAFQLRNRLPESERLLIEGSYYANTIGDLEKATQSLQLGVELDPTNVIMRNNLGVQYRRTGQLELAEATFREAIAVDPSHALVQQNLAHILLAQDRLDEAGDVLAEAEDVIRDLVRLQALVGYRRGNVDSAIDIAHNGLGSRRLAGLTDEGAFAVLVDLYLVSGRLRLAESQQIELMRQSAARNEWSDWLSSNYRVARIELLRGDVGAAKDRVDNMLREHPVSTIDILDRPYEELVYFFSLVRQPERAESL